MLSKLNKPALFALIFYPIFIISLVVKYSFDYGIGLTEVIFIIASYYINNITVGIGLHRLWSHNAYKINKYAEFVLIMLSAGTLQGPALSWASNHYKHHRYTDQDQDPHTPLKFDNKFLGFMWSHIGWMLVGSGSYKSIDRITWAKHGKNNLLKWQLKYYWQIAAFMNIVVPLFIGYLVGGTMQSAYAGFLFMGLGRFLQQQATFCVNSLCHFAGSKKYYKGTAGDIWWMALFLLGENWHNYHHAFPSDYRNGAKWYHFDVHKWIIFLMSKIGLASELERTTKVRIQAKMQETLSYLSEKQKQKLTLMQTKIDHLLENLCLKIKELEESSITIKEQFKKSFVEIQESLKNLAEQVSAATQITEKSSEKLLKIINKKIIDAEQSIYKLYNKLNTLKVSN
ncbi:acyl-CoA desaturase [Rickettsia sibirica]|uniref:Acyl-CoA desaturase 1 n=1 Tax=Rickettsia sibirica (strain ATCC VR-151 / 246) TaxID=272951 RepID=Q7PAG8_RICS2|nr:acyl-CoA desaturase [Rickettsia sibirica]EAA25869.1 acyl-CoA desaturase 1 [Rickettsia sibirica 246]